MHTCMYSPHFISQLGSDHLLFSGIAIGTGTLQSRLGPGRSSSGGLKRVEASRCLAGYTMRPGRWGPYLHGLKVMLTF